MSTSILLILDRILLEQVFLLVSSAAKVLLKKVKMEKHVACKETQQELTTHLSYFSEK